MVIPGLNGLKKNDTNKSNKKQALASGGQGLFL
jgi:hypothetical protein